jgi:dienelactone hydrolase
MTLALALLLALAQLDADGGLPRRAHFGVGVEKSANGIRVFTVAPGSTAEAVGVAVGDIIEAIDGQVPSTPEAVVASVGKHRSGESIKLELSRDGKRRAIEGKLKAYPTEQMANAAVQYGAVTAGAGVRLRTIVSVPQGQSGSRWPAVLLLQGGSCGSIDLPFNTNVGQPGLMHAIGSRGFVTMRVEKSGVGDSEGPACGSIGYFEELAGYRAALAALRGHPSVDRERVYLVGVSLGGVFAPVLASETKVAGISVYGTLARPPSTYAGRSDRFFEEFEKVDVAGAWARVGTRVQVLRGEYDVDPATSSAPERIVMTVNGAGGGLARYRELPGLDHCWTRHASLEASTGKCGQGQETTALVDAMLMFLRNQE